MLIRLLHENQITALQIRTGSQYASPNGYQPWLGRRMDLPNFLRTLCPSSLFIYLVIRPRRLDMCAHIQYHLPPDLAPQLKAQRMRVL